MPKNISDDPVTHLALDTINKQKQALVFVNTRQSAEKAAEDISKKLKMVPELEGFSNKILAVLSKPTTQCERLAFCTKRGIAFHHSGLAHEQKEMIEDAFRDKTIKIIVATPTLAYGIDTPAFRAIIRDLKRYGYNGLAWIPVLEYLQQSGRAGRPSYDDYGESIAIAKSESEKEEIYERYINGRPEDIYSKLAVEPVLRTYLLSLISADFVNTKKEIMNFFAKTFWAHQFKDMARMELIINKMLGLLEEWEFIRGTQDEFVPAGELGKEKYKAALLGKRVAELYLDPLTAHQLIEGLRKASSKPIVPFSFLQLLSNTLEMRPLLRVRTKDYELVQEALVRYNEVLLQEEPSLYEPEYEDFMNSVKTALFFQEWINEKDEQYLLEAFNIRPGEIRTKLELADWLVYSSAELCRILGFRAIIKELVKLRICLRYGAKEELFPLLRLKNVGRVRARMFFRNNIKDLGDVKKADLTTLTQILGSRKLAEDIKKQVELGIEKKKGLYSFE